MTNRRSREVRRRIGCALGGMLLIVGTVLLCVGRRDQALRRIQTENANAERARAEVAKAARAAVAGQIDGLNRDLTRVQSAPSREGELLAALARATPSSIALSEVSCEKDTFVIHGHRFETAGPPDDPLPRFRRDLSPRDSPWQIGDSPVASPGTAAGADFVWRGSFSAIPASPTDPATLEARLAAARAGLPTAMAFDRWIGAWSRHWNIREASTEAFPDLEVRHYSMAYDHPRLGSWSDIVQTLQALCAEPGLTIDSFSLAAAPDGADAFSRAEINLTARLRP